MTGRYWVAAETSHAPHRELLCTHPTQGIPLKLSSPPVPSARWHQKVPGGSHASIATDPTAFYPPCQQPELQLVPVTGTGPKASPLLCDPPLAPLQSVHTATLVFLPATLKPRHPVPVHAGCKLLSLPSASVCLGWPPDFQAGVLPSFTFLLRVLAYPQSITPPIGWIKGWRRDRALGQSRLRTSGLQQLQVTCGTKQLFSHFREWAGPSLPGETRPSNRILPVPKDTQVSYPATQTWQPLYQTHSSQAAQRTRCE